MYAIHKQLRLAFRAASSSSVCKFHFLVTSNFVKKKRKKGKKRRKRTELSKNKNKKKELHRMSATSFCG